MRSKKYKFESEVWLYPGETAVWHFITVPKEASQKIKEKHGANARGFGSLPVEVTIGKTTWRTSIFPSKNGVYILPLKANVRRSEGIFDGDNVVLALTVR